MLSDHTATGRGIEIANYLVLCPSDNNKSREAVNSSRKLINKHCTSCTSCFFLLFFLICFFCGNVHENAV